MTYSTYFKNAALDAVVGDAFVSLHTGDPGGTGAKEVSGGSPAYSRQSITFASASGGSKVALNSPVLDIPAGTTITHAGFWDAVKSGNFLGGTDIDDETFGGQGTYTVNSASLDMNG